MTQKKKNIPLENTETLPSNNHSDTLRLSLWVSVAAEKDFVGASLVSVLHKLLSDERSAPEIKYNSMILICAVMGSGESTSHS